jgi:hypothetical protein
LRAEIDRGPPKPTPKNKKFFYSEKNPVLMENNISKHYSH